MSRVYLELVKNKWKIVPSSNFWLDKYLLKKLINLKKIQSKEWDGVILIDGPERSGKSTLGMICGWYLSNGNLTEQNFASGLVDCAKKIQEIPDGSVLIVDEGSLVFSGKDSMNKEQKKLMKILDVVGQKNIIFIVCLPCVFDLNKTIAVRRSKFLLHVYPDSDYNRGNYAFWGERTKKKLYTVGKKNYDSYDFPRAEFIGKYFQFKPHFYELYLEKVKKDSLNEVLRDAIKGMDEESRLRNRFVRIIKRLRERHNFSYEEMSQILELSKATVHKYYNDEESLKQALTGDVSST